MKNLQGVASLSILIIFILLSPSTRAQVLRGDPVNGTDEVSTKKSEPKSWAVGLVYNSRVDMNDPLDGKVINHSLAAEYSYMLSDKKTMVWAGIGVQYESVGELGNSEILIDRQTKASFVRDINIGINRSYKLNSQYLLLPSLGFILPTSLESREEKYLGLTSARAILVGSYLKRKLSVAHSLGTSYLAHRMRQSISTTEVNSDVVGSYSLAITYRLSPMFSIMAFGGMQMRHYFDQSWDDSYRNGFSLRFFRKGWLVSLSYINSTYADSDDGVDLLFVDEYRKLFFGSVGFQF